MRLAAPKISVKLKDDISGSAVRLDNGDKAIYVLLTVRNLRPYTIAKNCIIQIEGISRKDPIGGFYSLSMSHHLPLVWTPAEEKCRTKTINPAAVADLGRVRKSQMRFERQVSYHPNDFDGGVIGKQIVRYSLRVYPEGARPSRLFVFEISWNGQWSDTVAEMYEHLKIRDLSDSM